MHTQTHWIYGATTTAHQNSHTFILMFLNFGATQSFFRSCSFSSIQATESLAAFAFQIAVIQLFVRFYQCEDEKSTKQTKKKKKIGNQITRFFLNESRSETEKPQTNNGTQLHKSQNIRKYQLYTMESCDCWPFFCSWVQETYFMFSYSTITWLPAFLSHCYSNTIPNDI